MPYVYAHALCGERTLELLCGAAKDRVASERALFLFGAQGPDPWFYHNASPLMRGKSCAQFGNALHADNVDATIAAMLQTVLEGDTDRRFGYFAGYLCHYALDAAVHPYVLYRTQEPRFHTPFEAEIDLALLQSRGETLLTRPLKKLIAPIPAAPFAALHEAAARALGYPLPCGAAGQAIAHTLKLLPLLSDPFGLKRPVFALLETLAGRAGDLTGKLFSPHARRADDPLNAAHASWQAPWSEEIVTDSFFDLFESAAKNAAQYATILYEAVYGGLPVDAALKRFGSLSFDTGLPWRTVPRMLHFRCAYRSV